jgi:hypothetical protein
MEICWPVVRPRAPGRIQPAVRVRKERDFAKVFSTMEEGLQYGEFVLKKLLVLKEEIFLRLVDQ